MTARRLVSTGVFLLGALLTPLPASASAADCTAYQSIGATSPNAIEYGLPYEIYGGAPYVETEMSSQPKARALASGAYPGQIGEILIGTSGAGVDDPTTRQVFWPAVQGKKSTDGFDGGPAVRTFATAAAGPQALAWASNAGAKVGDSVSLGPSYASSQGGFRGGVLSGHDESWSYDVQLDGARVDAVHSLIDYRTDGSRAGTIGRWRLDVLGIGTDGSKTVSISGDGVSVQGSAPQPGTSARQQVQSAAKQLSDALEQAGVGRVDVLLEPGKVKVSPGRIELRGADLVVKVQPQATAGNIGQTVQLLLGYEERVVTLKGSDCGSQLSSPIINGLPPVDDAVPPASPVVARPSTDGPASTALGTTTATPSTGTPPVVQAPLQAPVTLSAALQQSLWPRRFYRWSLLLILISAGALWALYAGTHRSLRLRRP